MQLCLYWVFFIFKAEDWRVTCCSAQPPSSISAPASLTAAQAASCQLQNPPVLNLFFFLMLRKHKDRFSPSAETVTGGHNRQLPSPWGQIFALQHLKNLFSSPGDAQGAGSLTVPQKKKGSFLNFMATIKVFSPLLTCFS